MAFVGAWLSSARFILVREFFVAPAVLPPLPLPTIAPNPRLRVEIRKRKCLCDNKFIL
jgi:hypothetical protein